MKPGSQIDRGTVDNFSNGSGNQNANQPLMVGSSNVNYHITSLQPSVQDVNNDVLQELEALKVSLANVGAVNGGGARDRGGASNGGRAVNGGGAASRARVANRDGAANGGRAANGGEAANRDGAANGGKAANGAGAANGGVATNGGVAANRGRATNRVGATYDKRGRWNCVCVRCSG